MKNIVMKGIYFIAVAGFLISSFVLFRVWREYKANEESYARMQVYQPKIDSAVNGNLKFDISASSITFFQDFLISVYGLFVFGLVNT